MPATLKIVIGYECLKKVFGYTYKSNNKSKNSYWVCIANFSI